MAVMPTWSAWVAALAPLLACGQIAPGEVAQLPAGAIAPTAKPETVASLEQGFADVAARVGPAVVKIEADHGAPWTSGVVAQASGVIIDGDGLMLTNAHVVEGASTVRVTLPDERELTAAVLGTDTMSDIAVLDIDADDLPFLPLGDSDEVRVGDFVLAVGNPFGVGQAVTLGIVSAVGRGQLGIFDDEDFIQTDAAINPGNSGGALVNTSGELVGIATAIVTGSRGNTGVGFAVPSRTSARVMKEIIAQGRVVRGWLGAGLQDLTPALVEQLDLATARGALVADVADEGPAARAGVQRGDVVVGVDGAPVNDGYDLRVKVRDMKPGTRVTLTTTRAQATRKVAVVVTEHLPEESPRDEETPPGPGDARAAVGILVHALTAPLAEELEVPQGTNGVVVTAVARGSRGARAGLRPGDVIVEMDKQPVSSPLELQQQVKGKKGPLLMLVMRDAATSFLVLEP